MNNIIIPVSICVVLPVLIVAIYSYRKINNDNRRTQVLIKAIEANNEIDAESLAKTLAIPRKSRYEVLYSRLLRGCIFSLVGLFMVVFSIVQICMGTEPSADPVTVPGVFGGASIAVGLSYLIVYFVSRGQVVNKEEK